MTITYKDMLRRETETNTDRPRPRSTGNSLSHNNNQEVTRRNNNHRVVFSTTRDTTCVYPKGLTLPLAVQKTFVFNGASILRVPDHRPALMARYGSISQTNYAFTRRVGFGPAVKAEAGRVTSTKSHYLKCRILLPIREEEGRKRRRSTDDTAGIDAALALPESKKICLRVEIASQVNRHGIKRRWDTTTTAENDAAPEHKFKRARVCADESQVQSVEVSRFLLFLISYSLFLSRVHFLHLNLIYILLIDPSLTIMSCRLSLLLRTSPSRQPMIPSSRMSSPRKHPLNSEEKKWRLRLRQHSGVRWLLCSHLLDPTGYDAIAVGCVSDQIALFHRSENDQCLCLAIGSLLLESAEVGGSHF